jgi:hypothetical protein
MRILMPGGRATVRVVRVSPATAPPLTRGCTPEQEAAVLAAVGCQGDP